MKSKRVVINCLSLAAFASLLLIGKAWSEPTIVYASDLSVCTIVGTDSNDLLVGTAGPDVICGLGGDDTIRGLNGDDVIDAGSGNDAVTGGTGNDSIDPGTGTDTAAGNTGINTLYLGSAGVNLTVSLSKGTVSATEYTSKISGFQNVTTGSGADIIQGSSAANLISTGEGDDLVKGDSGNDVINAGLGLDTLDFSKATTTKRG